MSLSLFNAIPTGSIEVRHKFKNIAGKSRCELLKDRRVLSPALLQYQNNHDAFVDLNTALEIVVRSRKPKAVGMVKWPMQKVLKKS